MTTPAFSRRESPAAARLGRMRACAQRGFSLVTAIFLLVVLAALGAAMATFFVAQQQSAALDVLGSRAYQAARAGIEWAADNISQQAPGTQWPGCATGATFPANSLGGTMSPFSVTVTCVSAPYTDDAAVTFVYNVEAVAVGVNGAQPGNADYVERVIDVKIGR